MSESDARTPPTIVAAADHPPTALAAFIAQELEHWGFDVSATPVDTSIKAQADHVVLYVHTSRHEWEERPASGGG